MILIAIVYDDKQVLDDTRTLDDTQTFDDTQDVDVLLDYILGTSQVEEELMFIGGAFPVSIPVATSGYLIGYEDYQKDVNIKIGIVEEKQLSMHNLIGLIEDNRFDVKYKIGVIEDEDIDLISRIGLIEEKEKSVKVNVGVIEDKELNATYIIGVKELQETPVEVKVGLIEDVEYQFIFEIEKIYKYPIKINAEFKENLFELGYKERQFNLDCNEKYKVSLFIKDCR